MASMASKLSKSYFRSKRLSNFKLDKRSLSRFRSDTHVSDYAFTFVLNIDLFYDKNNNSMQISSLVMAKYILAKS
jgi:hypothetical protein